jgi:hypothetical protein
MTMKDRRDDELNKRIDVILCATNRGTKIDQFTKRIHIVVEREWILELTNVHRPLHVNELKAQHHLRDVRRGETRSSQLHERGILRTPLKVPSKQHALDAGGSRSTRHVKHEVSLGREFIYHVANDWSLPQV